MQLGRERARGNSIGWSVLRLTSNCIHSFKLFKFEQENDRTNMHIGTVCKDTVSPEFFTQWLRFYFWGLTLTHVICLVLTG